MSIQRLLSGRSALLFFASVFVFFLAFFSVFHPALITTPDDWYYIGYTRDALPLLDKHNPTRVLPEVLMPVVATVSSMMLRPFGIDIVWAIAYGTALLLAALITLYAYNFYRLIRQKLSVDEAPALCITALFLLFHFLAFRSSKIDNIYLFGSFCLTNFYYYNVPILLNASLVMYCIRTDLLQRLSSLSYFRQGLFLAACYFCMLSNLYSNIILAVYFLLELLRDCHSRSYRLKQCLLDNKFIVSMLLFFLVILWFEVNGGNAKHLTAGDGSFLMELKHTCGSYCRMLLDMNGWFVTVCTVVTVVSAVMFYRHCKAEGLSHKFLPWPAAFICLSFLLVNIFSILISAKAKPYYVSMSEKMLMEFFWLLVGVSTGIAYCVKRCPRLTALLPLLFLVLFCHTNTKTKTFCDVHGFATMPQFNDQLLSILDDANRQHVDSLTLYVPKVEGEADNWPFLTYVGPEFANVFYGHRLTRKRLEIRVEAVPGLTNVSSSLEMSPSVSVDPKPVTEVCPQDSTSENITLP